MNAAPTLPHDPEDPDPTPNWVPKAARAYLAHVRDGVAIRELARETGCHASTILRQIRKVETDRDDPLKDEVLDRLASQNRAPASGALPTETETDPMTEAARIAEVDNDAAIEREALRVLRRLCESKAFLIVSPELEKAAVFRETVPGRRTRTAVVQREFAQVFALKDWIKGDQRGKVAIYTVTSTGRAALKRLIAKDSTAHADRTYAEQPSPFQEQHRTFGARTVNEDGEARKVRYNLAESPLSVLSRKRGPDGSAYLSPAMLEAGERLREDFELAQMGPRVTQNWDNFLTAASGGSYQGDGRTYGPEDARRRVADALAALGPGLADIAFRCCCFLEGLETAEKRLGWSARAGKVVLKIALQRLVDHYAGAADSRMVGYAASGE